MIEILLENGIDYNLFSRNNVKKCLTQNKLFKSMKLFFDAANSDLYVKLGNFKIAKDVYENIVNTSIKNSFLATSIINYYKPYSIDYFMIHIEDLAPYEFVDLEHNSYEIKAKIYDYTKFIIADILMSNLTYAYYAMDDNNYLKNIIWRMNEYAHFYNKNLLEFLLKSVKFINFNYDNSLLLMLCDILHTNGINKISKNIEHIYGNLHLKTSKKQQIIFMCNQNSIWESLFSIDNDNFTVKISNAIDHKEVKIKGLIKQISNNIDWIGESKNQLGDRRKRQKTFLEADEIYFLGFGFDINNLYNLGLMNKQYIVEDKIKNNLLPKRIFVSGGNHKIINLIRDVFKITKQEESCNVYCLKNENLNLEFYISMNFLPEALISDF